MDDAPRVQRREHRSTDLGEAEYIRIFTPNYRKLSWREIWECFSDRFPGMWAVEVFPPADELVDDENVYHLFVFSERPRGLTI